MKIITEEEYHKLEKADQDKHHKEIREQLIEVGLVKAGVIPDQNASKTSPVRV